MSLFSKINTISKTLLVLSVITMVSIVGIFFIVYNYIEQHNDLRSLSLLLLFIIVLLTAILIYFLWKKAYDDFLKSELQENIEVLEKKLQKAETLAEHNSVYLANMSHEIRIPLNAILGMLKMLKKTSLDSDQMAEVEIAQYSSEHLLQLVNMILDNSQFDYNRTKLQMDVIDLELDLSNLFKVFEYQAWDKNLEFEHVFLSEKKSKFLLLGDLARIQQVLVNLFNNAIKFTHSGKITITIHQTASDDDHQIVTFYVKDTGVGMTPYELKQFLNVPAGNNLNSSKHYRGAGLGLSVSNKLVQLMGGELELESKENEGSIFYFSLQLKKTLNLKDEPKETETVLFEDLDYKFHVLVAEDNKMNQKVIKFLLEQQGADCTLVKNGLEAVKLFNILNFDMVFMDMYMPEMDGFEATKIIKSSDRYTENKSPIIGVSASAFAADIKKAKQSGVDDFLAKPIEIEKLKELLKRYTAEKQEG
ncbi:response regulator [Flavobacteriaceae bacterium XHP0103]|uniref:response regulator n=1 Tax=Marixanthotalea marina TaxID=2844359 RepID=UPI002989A2FE|nr:response regulator [Marixanthotalea marina]MBU3821498.1 response regulator [Marixanthotalea marina]